MKSLLELIKNDLYVGSVWYHRDDGDTKYTIDHIDDYYVWFAVEKHDGMYEYRKELVDGTVFRTSPKIK